MSDTAIYETIKASSTVEEMAAALRDWAEAMAVEVPEFTAQEWLTMLQDEMTTGRGAIRITDQ